MSQKTSSQNPSRLRSPTRLCFLEYHVTDWELDEIECAYYHLNEHYSISSRNPPLHTCPAIVERLLINLGYEPGDSVPTGLHQGFVNYLGYSRVERLTDTCWWAPDLLETPKSRTARSDMPPANLPNEGWTSHVQYGNGGFLMTFSYCGEVVLEPLLWFYNLGFYMWDKARFIKWGLLEEKCDYLNPEGWEDEAETRACCIPVQAEDDECNALPTIDPYSQCWLVGEMDIEV